MQNIYFNIKIKAKRNICSCEMMRHTIKKPWYHRLGLIIEITQNRDYSKIKSLSAVMTHTKHTEKGT